MALSVNLLLLLQTYVVIALPTGINQSAASGNSKGRAFMVSFLQSLDSHSQNSIIITTEKKTRVYVSVPSSTAPVKKYSLKANSSLYLQLPYETTVTSWGNPEHKAVSVYSSEPVSVYGMTTRNKSGSGYLAIPLDKWSDHYTVATYDGYMTNGGEIIIISAENNTSVTLRLNVAKPVWCGLKNRTTDSSSLLSFPMNREEVIRIACSDDITGSVINSSKPIGVISGNTCTRVPSNVPFCDQLAEMMIPTTNLGTDYIVTGLADRDTIFRVIYTDFKGSTNVTIEDDADVTVTKGNRLYKEYRISSHSVVRLHASRPVLVVLYSLGTKDYSADDGPSMTVMVPIERYDSEYNVASSWKEMPHFRFDVTVFSPGGVPHPFARRVGVISSARKFGFTVIHANITNSSLLTKNSFITDSNIILSASTLATTVTFPVGMKLDFFTGVDHCSNSPCLNGGICYTHGAKLSCYCGYELAGDYCENRIVNACSSFPCQNNSTCRDFAHSFKCECQDNFTGDLCETGIVNACSSFPCQNNSTCRDFAHSFKCECQDNFTGDLCETGIVNACGSFPCQNNSTCRDFAHSFKCECQDNFTGDLCETGIVNACSSFPCQNNSTCRDFAHSFKCECQDNFTGDLCETGIVNACSSFPCQNNSTCRDFAHSFKCECQDSFTGDLCETGIVNACSSFPCQNNSTCRDFAHSFKCECQDNFTGDLCETELKAMTTTSKPKTTGVRETEICKCTCENSTSEEIQDKKEKIKKELSVDPKKTNKNKIKYTSAYDSRPSATGIGIVGVLFLVLVFACFMALDLISAVTYIVAFIKDKRKPNRSENYINKSTKNTNSSPQWNYYGASTNSISHFRSTSTDRHELSTGVNSGNEKSELVLAPLPLPLPCLNSLYRNARAMRQTVPEVPTEDVQNYVPASADSNLDQLYEDFGSEISTCTHRGISFPRFKIYDNKILVVGEDGKTFRI